MSTPIVHAPNFEIELSLRMLVSEGRRTRILAWILTALAVLATIYALIEREKGFQIPGFRWFIAALWAGCAYEWAVRWFVVRAAARGDRPARFRFYLNALGEIGIPTSLMLIYAAHASPVDAISGPASYAYFLFIIPSALRLDFRICLFTGAAAAVGYLIVGLLHWPALEAAFQGTESRLRVSFGMRVLFFLLGGFVAGLVSASIRRTLVETAVTMRERERVVDLFGQQVSPAVVDQLLAHPAELVSELREICVLVLDIRSFTTFSESRAPEAVVAYLNTLWTFLVQTINEHHGFVNKFLGDGFLAVFGAPISAGNDCANAVAAARGILRQIEEQVAAGQLPPTRIGMALHAGQAIVGNVGSAERKEYTIIGDVVNVAFRIEALNKELGSRLLISEAVRTAASVEEAERLAPMPIRGRQELMEISRLG